PIVFRLTRYPTPPIYTLSLHDALPISGPHDLRARRRRTVAGMDVAQRHHEHALHGHLPAQEVRHRRAEAAVAAEDGHRRGPRGADRKSTRLNSSHQIISYAVFCLKKKK